MTEYLVRYTLMHGVYETRIRTSSSGLAIELVEKLFPNVTNVHIVG